MDDFSSPQRINPGENLSLVALIADVIRGERSQRKLLSKVSAICQIRAISSIYKRDFSDGARGSELVAVIQVASQMSKIELFQALSEVAVIEAGANSHARLLSFNQEVAMTPGVTIPDPSLFQDRLILQCAAEVWGDFEHPIVGKTLNELVKSCPITDTVEFFSQGAYLF